MTFRLSDPKKEPEGSRYIIAFHRDFDSDIEVWKKSMRKLLELNADILCEGHFGIFESKERARSYIEGYLEEYE